MRISDWSSDVCSSDLLMQKLRMSRKEVKDELKQTEGSPEVKMALRRKQREATRNNVRAGVQQAHVILTNPTHFAVALRYDRATDRPPVVVSKGQGLVAEVIRRPPAGKARQSGV